MCDVPNAEAEKSTARVKAGREYEGEQKKTTGREATSEGDKLKDNEGECARAKRR